MSKQVNVGNEWYDVVNGPLPSKTYPDRPWFAEYRLGPTTQYCFVRDSELRDTPPAIEVPSELFVNIFQGGIGAARRDQSLAAASIAGKEDGITVRYVLPLPWKKCGQGTPPPLAMKLFQFGDYYITEDDLLATLPKEVK
jgi:hypothetical protein